MTLDRRNVLSAGIAAGLAAGAATAGARSAEARTRSTATGSASLVPGSAIDQTAALQAAIDAATGRGAPLELPAGRYRVGATGAATGRAHHRRGRGNDAGVHRRRRLHHRRPGRRHSARRTCARRRLSGARRRRRGSSRSAIRRGVRLRHLTLTRSAANGISLIACAGSVSDCNVTSVMQAAIRSVDASGDGDCAQRHCRLRQQRHPGVALRSRRGRQHRFRQPHRAHPRRRRRQRRERQRRQRFPRRQRARLRQPHHRLRLQRRARQRGLRHPDHRQFVQRGSARSPSTPSSASKAR